MSQDSRAREKTERERIRARKKAERKQRAAMAKLFSEMQELVADPEMLITQVRKFKAELSDNPALFKKTIWDCNRERLEKIKSPEEKEKVETNTLRIFARALWDEAETNEQKADVLLEISAECLKRGVGMEKVCQLTGDSLANRKELERLCLHKVYKSNAPEPGNQMKIIRRMIKESFHAATPKKYMSKFEKSLLDGSAVDESAVSDDLNFQGFLDHLELYSHDPKLPERLERLCGVDESGDLKDKLTLAQKEQILNQVKYYNAMDGKYEQLEKKVLNQGIKDGNYSLDERNFETFKQNLEGHKYDENLPGLLTAICNGERFTADQKEQILTQVKYYPAMRGKYDQLEKQVLNQAISGNRYPLTNEENFEVFKQNLRRHRHNGNLPSLLAEVYNKKNLTAAQIEEIDRMVIDYPAMQQAGPEARRNYQRAKSAALQAAQLKETQQPAQQQQPAAATQPAAQPPSVPGSSGSQPSTSPDAFSAELDNLRREVAQLRLQLTLATRREVAQLRSQIDATATRQSLRQTMQQATGRAAKFNQGAAPKLTRSESCAQIPPPLLEPD